MKLSVIINGYDDCSIDTFILTVPNDPRFQMEQEVDDFKWITIDGWNSNGYIIHPNNKRIILLQAVKTIDFEELK